MKNEQQKNFRSQIIEKIRDYQKYYPQIDNINKDDWAFNFWVLDQIYHIEESIISDYIIDYKDRGIDCYVWHKESKDLFLIQNKFYDENTRLTEDYIQNNFLVMSKGALEKGTYNHCQELQDIFTQYKNDEEFAVHYRLYVTNNSSITKKIQLSVDLFNEKYAKENYDCKLYNLDDIEKIYYGKPFSEAVPLTFEMKTVNKNSLLSINPEIDGLDMAVSAKYMLTPVTLIDNLYNVAESKKYNLFESNVRQYLGSSPVNKKIRLTLLDENERNNFFFYNNGITMIVNRISDMKEIDGKYYVFNVENPQIVNGCQTVSTIHDTLSDQKNLVKDGKYDNTFVMMKILEIPTKGNCNEYDYSEDDSNDPQLTLRKNIVKYNNNQNAINDKLFTSNLGIFQSLKDHFEGKGFLIVRKGSGDLEEYSEKYGKKSDFNKLLSKSNELLNKFSIPIKKVKDLEIELEKVLQVFLSFKTMPVDAIQNKSKLLPSKDNLNVPQHTVVVNFIQDKNYSLNDQINLVLLYKSCELRMAKKPVPGEDAFILNPFYLIYSFAKYDLPTGNSISSVLRTKEDVERIIAKNEIAFGRYSEIWNERDENKGKGYNAMVKSTMDEKLWDEAIKYALLVIKEIDKRRH